MSDGTTTSAPPAVRHAIRMHDFGAFCEAIRRNVAPPHSDERHATLGEVCKMNRDRVWVEQLLRDENEGEPLLRFDDQTKVWHDRTGNTALHFAASKSNVAVVELLLAHGLAATTPNRHADTPLHKAVSRPQTSGGAGESTAVVKLLLDHGASVTAQNRHGVTPVHTCARLATGGQLMRQLLASAQDDLRSVLLETRSNSGRVPLHEAAEAASLECAEALLESGLSTEQVVAVDSEGNTPLLAFALKGLNPSFGGSFDKLVRLLAADETVVAMRSNDGRSVLHDQSTTAEFASLLLELGADPNVAADNGSTPLQCATRCGAPHRIDALLAGGATLPERAVLTSDEWRDKRKSTIVHMLACDNRLQKSLEKVLDSLPDSSEAVNEPNAEGSTALHLATTYDAVNNVRLLIEKKASRTAVDAQGRTPARLAFESLAVFSLPVIVEESLDAVDWAWVATLRTPERHSLLYRAAAYGATDCVKLLVKKCPDLLDVAVPDPDGFNPGGLPMHCAVANGHIECVKALQAAGSALSSQDEFYGNTPVHLAASRAKLEILEILVLNGAARTLSNMQGERPADLCDVSTDVGRQCVELLVLHVDRERFPELYVRPTASKES